MSADATESRDPAAGSAPDAAVLGLAGELDMAAVDAAEARLREALRQVPRRLVLDLSAVTFVDSTGIRTLLRANDLCVASGVELTLTRPPEGVWRMLERFRLDTRLPFAASAPAVSAAPTRVPDGEAAGELRMELASDPQAPGLARHATADAVADLPESLRDAALLLVSEVVTNAVRHGCSGPDDRIRLTLARLDDGVRIEVEDPGPGVPDDVSHHGEGLVRESGWGLVMVDRMASRWGIEHHPSRVWFELDA